MGCAGGLPRPQGDTGEGRTRINELFNLWGPNAGCSAKGAAAGRRDGAMAGAKDTGMDPASIAATLVGAQAGQTQTALAADMMKINAQAQRSIANMVDASAQQASLPPGIGQNLDIRA